MVALILAVCLSGPPGDCYEVRVPFDQGMQACSVLGQMVAAEWLAEHPKYELSGWRCATGKET